MNQTNASLPQPDPTPGKQRVLDVVLDDIKERAESGRAKYGTYLETHNGRVALWDAYQEHIDLLMYLRQELLEREGEGGIRLEIEWADPILPLDEAVRRMIPPLPEPRTTSFSSPGSEGVITLPMTVWITIAAMLGLVGLGFILGLAAAGGAG